MVATSLSKPKTYEDYLNTPDDGQRYELIDGEIFVSPSPILLHQEAVAELLVRLRAYAKQQGAGKVILSPMDVRLDRDIVVQPDLVFVRKGSAADNPEEPRIVGSPDLLIEVLSPSNRSHDQVRKRELYARFGVPEYWIVDPIQRTITMLTLNDGAYGETRRKAGALKSNVLPGFELNVSEFFEAVYS